MAELLGRERLVTLIGPGGTGKTRLAIEAARTVADRYPDGSCFVALEALRDPGLVLPEIAVTLGVPDQPRRPIETVLGEFLDSRRALLILDNLEQVIEAAPDIGALLGAASGLDILATSREPLSIAGEHVYQVQPLGLPAEPGVRSAAGHRVQRVGRAVRRASPSRPFGLHAERRERTRHRVDLPAPGWPATGDRAGRRSRQRPVA